MVFWVGAEAPPNSGETYQEAFQRVNGEIGPLKVYRAYLQGPPWPTYDSSSRMSWAKNEGYHLFVSITPDPAALAAGTYDSELADLIQSFPTGWQWWLTCNHEPEAPGKNIDPSDYVAAISHLHSVAHSLSSDVEVGTCNMVYQWKTGRQVDATGGPSAWVVPATNCDFYGVDTYSQSPDQTTLEADDRQQRWHDTFSGLGKPLWVVERGIDALYGESTVAGYLSDDATWMQANGYEGLVYWQVTNGDYELTGASAAEFQSIATGGETDSPVIGDAELFVDSGSGGISSITGTLVNWLPGDTVLVAVWLSANGTVTVTPPAGWNLVDGPEAASTNSWTLWLFSRKMQSGDGNPTFTVASGRVTRAISINAGANWDGIVSPGTLTGGTATVLNTGSTTPGAAGKTSLVIIGFRNSTAGSPTWTNDSDLTQDSAFDGSGGSPNTHYWVGHGSLPNATTSYTQTTSQSTGAYTATALTLTPTAAITIGKNVNLSWDVVAPTGGGGDGDGGAPPIGGGFTRTLPPPIPHETGNSRYTYIAADLLTNRIFGELPLVSVTMDRAINGVGNLSASLHLDDEHFDNSDLIAWTTTGKTALYVYRDQAIVWGGILWTRTYQSQGKSLQVTAQTFESYAYKRIYRPQATVELIDDQCNLVASLWTELQRYSNTDIGVQSPTNIPQSGIVRDYVINPWDFRSFGDLIEDITTNFDDSCQYYIDVFEDPNTNKPVKQLRIGYPIATQETGLVCDYPGNVLNYYFTENANEGANRWWATGDGSEAAIVVGVAEDYAATGGQPANLIGNPDFEVDTSGWTAYVLPATETTTITRETVSPINGTASIKCTWTNGAFSSGAIYVLPHDIPENTAITVSFWAKCPNGDPGTIRVNFNDGTGVWSHSENTDTVPVDTPQLITVKYTVEVGHFIHSIYIYANSGGTGNPMPGTGPLIFDDVNVSDGSYNGPITPSNPLIEGINNYSGVTQQDTINGHAASDLKNSPIPVGKWQITIKPDDIDSWFFAVGYSVRLMINGDEDPRFPGGVDIPIQTFGYNLTPSGGDVESLDLTLDNSSAGGSAE